jgi:hypothetical protein
MKKARRSKAVTMANGRIRCSPACVGSNQRIANRQLGGISADDHSRERGIHLKHRYAMKADLERGFLRKT